MSDYLINRCPKCGEIPRVIFDGYIGEHKLLHACKEPEYCWSFRSKNTASLIDGWNQHTIKNQEVTHNEELSKSRKV